jgi:predicted nucleotidyltransferase
MVVVEFEYLRKKNMSVLNKQLLKEELLASPLLDIVKTQLKATDEIIAIVLAGSQASEVATETSDIDLAILTQNS